MVLGKLQAEWNQTSHILAAVLNSQWGRRQPVHPHQLNPYASRETGVTLDDVFGLNCELAQSTARQ